VSRYGWNHQQIRQALLAKAWGTPCHFCGAPMLPHQALDLDHHVDGNGYRGITHAACNRADGARRGNAARSTGYPPPRF